MVKILFTVEKIGPYHNSRFNDFCKYNKFKLNVLESNTCSKRYPWEENLNKKYTVYKLPSKKIKYSKSQTKFELNKLIKKTKPDIVFLSGWDENISHYLLFICQIKNIPIVMVSDSREKDFKRNIFKELIKKLLLKGCSSGIVAGTESEDYLIKLGFKKSSIFKPVNVVDNNFFFAKNIRVSNKYILCVSRFLKRKNHIKLLKAFEDYKKKGGTLKLILIGSGPEKENIVNTSNKLLYASHISIETWKDIYELKEYYLNAKILVLLSKTDNWGLVVNEAMASSLPCIVSNECGSYIDLIKDKNTGWGVNPEDESQLSNLFQKIDKTRDTEFIQRQKNSLNIINGYSLEKFSSAVKDSTLYSLKNQKFSFLSLITAYLLFLFK